eukprot:4174116-Pyramimonas_sp.AAC.1
MVAFQQTWGAPLAFFGVVFFVSRILISAVHMWGHGGPRPCSLPAALRDVAYSRGAEEGTLVVWEGLRVPQLFH